MRLPESVVNPYMPDDTQAVRKSVQSHSVDWKDMFPDSVASQDVFRRNVQKSKDFFHYTEIDT